jgi:hypothetical protein
MKPGSKTDVRGIQPLLVAAGRVGLTAVESPRAGLFAAGAWRLGSGRGVRLVAKITS